MAVYLGQHTAHSIGNHAKKAFHATRHALHTTANVMDTVRPIAEVGKHFLPGHARQVVDKGLSAYDSVRKAIKM